MQPLLRPLLLGATMLVFSCSALAWEPFCHCEHLSSPFDDVCEAGITPDDNGWLTALGTFDFQTSGSAYLHDVNHNWAWYSCPQGTPPGYPTCAITVTVTSYGACEGNSDKDVVCTKDLFTRTTVCQGH